MKNHLLFAIFAMCLAASATSAQDRSIQFEHGTWQEIKAKAARKTNSFFWMPTRVGAAHVSGCR